MYTNSKAFSIFIEGMMYLSDVFFIANFRGDLLMFLYDVNSRSGCYSERRTNHKKKGVYMYKTMIKWCKQFIYNTCGV